MALLTLNGIDMPVVEARRSQVAIGSSVRAFDGSPRVGRRKVRREWRFTTGPLDLDTATAVRGLVESDGHCLPFDGPDALAPAVYDTAGQRTMTTSNYSIVTWAGRGGMSRIPSTFSHRANRAIGHHTAFAIDYRYGGSGIHKMIRGRGNKLVAGGAIDFTWYNGAPGTGARGQLGPPWEIGRGSYMGEDEIRLTTPIGTWATAYRVWAPSTAYTVGLVVRGDGGAMGLPAGDPRLEYVYRCVTAGTSGASAPAWQTDTSAAARTIDGSCQWEWFGYWPGHFDDFVFYHFKVPDSWALQIATFHLARPWSPLPRVYASGSFAGGAEVLVLGEVEHVEATHLNNGATGEIVEFVLREV